jgi:hypothetical protein
MAVKNFPKSTIENPYKLTTKILKSLGLFTSNSLDKINAKL